jgi:hypothetical protein
MDSMRMTVPVVLVLLSTVSPPLAGQTSGAPTAALSIWATGGGGASSEGLGGVLGLDLLHGHHLLSLRAAGAAGILEDDFSDFAALYGRARRWRRGTMALSSGVAVMRGNRCSGVFSPCSHVPARFGLPIAARVSWHALPFLGLGIYGFANVNGAQSFSGVVLAVEVGRIR